MSPLPYRRRAAVIAALTCACLASLTACGGLSGSSSCSDYLSASSEDQQKVVNELAQQYNKPAYATPLGFPSVAYACASQASLTLDEFFQRAQ